MAANVTSNTSASPRQLSKNLQASGRVDPNLDSRDKPHTTAEQKPILSAQFDHRLMINFQMSSHLIASHLPAGLELLPFRSGYYVTFMVSHVRGVKKFGLPIFPGFNAISLRTYVRSMKHPELTGALTLKRYVSSSVGAWLLKKNLGLPAIVIPIKRKIKSEKGALLPSVGYLWKIGDAESVLRVKARSQIFTTSENSKHGWMLDHLNEFSASKNGVFLRRALKPKCKTFDVAKANFKCNAKKMFGPSFVKPLSSRPSSVYLFHGGKTQFFGQEKM